MKTTIELPDNLVVAAKQQAAARRTTLKVLIEAGLRHELAAGEPAAKRVKIRWVTVKGGLPPNTDISDRSSMTEWMTREKTKLRHSK